MNKVRRVKPNFEEPEFPHWNQPQTVAGFIVGALLWILMVLGFLFLFYVQLFSFNTRYLLSLIKPKAYYIPFWFSIIIVVFLFPLSLAVIVLGSLVRILRD